ncbi:MAG: lytic murein transglycosylase [Candidatus Thioglobus sp.]|nr:MAG: lytic murein transglycosylase [Candidatus Thioglobus sp.]RUM81597.1 MAG: lytic murein transglycosylase [Candidatus Thioglobus sp.]RUM84995.1 MAG: lytic murein transglycosylase [Candidatus Thioglobus sp.]RUM85368.1 MAG: lytic murein transglycosylase [Candidatus Thioglobus sp.]
MLRLIFCLLLTTSAYANDTTAHSFESFLADIRTQAGSQGVSAATLDQAFHGLTPNPKVIKFDRSQAEFSQNFWRYLGSRVSPYRLKNGRKLLQEHQATFQHNYQKYGVPPHIIVAFWGLETNYGSNTGNLNLVRSLATLSFDERRSAFFTTQLLALLKLIDDNKIPLDAQGSWAGAMGNVQFMPTNVVAYGVDADGDGEIGLWDNKADIFSSAANFLQKIGWHRGERWGREVTIPSNFDYQLANLSTKKTVNEWQALDVRTATGKDLPSSTMKASLVLPMGYSGPAFLAYRNFRAILRWNRSILYALSVGHLSDRLAGTSGLIAKPITEPSLSRDDIKFIQISLNRLGFDTGEPDGISGPKTRGATRQYQRDNNLPIDGYVGYQLLQQLQAP